MKSTLRISEKKLRGPKLGPASQFPQLRPAPGTGVDARLDESDGLFIGYGIPLYSLPHTPLGEYGGPAVEQKFTSVVLENEFLRAEFLPELGGRLWSLFDKENGRDLVVDNQEFRPGNLGLRNAWFAGGIEWNCGRRGHDAQTCEPLFSGIIRDERGEDGLRMYEFNRDRAITRQMDFFLPSDSRFLFARMRIVNPNHRVEPVYWWSNIAVEKIPGMRIIVPAHTTFANTYVNEFEHHLCKLPMPENEGIDCTYPENYRYVKDHFFNLDPDARRWEAAVFPDGYGILYASTARLRGRKLFVWGESTGGQNWQRRLLSPGIPGYIEIQGGLSQTQMESLPMPPDSAWEWLEAFGALHASPGKVFGPWEEAIAHIAGIADKTLPQNVLDDRLARASFVREKAELIRQGSGWGALENFLRKQEHRPPLEAHLDFGEPGELQRPWVELLTRGRLPGELPRSCMIQPEWHARLKAVKKPGWPEWYQLSLHALSECRYEEALHYASRAVRQECNAATLHAEIAARFGAGKKRGLAEKIESLLEMRPGDVQLVMELLKDLMDLGRWSVVETVWPKLTPTVRRTPMVRFLRASALARDGQAEKAWEILQKLPEIPDIREGETSLSELYLLIRSRMPEKLPPEVPSRFDLRMNGSR